MTQELKLELQRFALQIRIGILEQLKARGFGHIGGSLSVADALAVLYGSVMRVDAENSTREARDKLVCSKGHAGPAVYAALALKGFFPYDELKTLNQPGTRLPSHCDRNKTPGVDMTTGSLGQGTSLAVGMALGDKLKGLDSRTFLIVGDGEANEGQVWEAAMWAAHENLDNLVAIVDRNHLQIDGDTADVCDPGDMCAKFSAFGWEASQVDGHDIDALIKTLNVAKRAADGRPHVLVANTIKGRGVSFMENQAGWHGKAPNAEQTEQAVAELEAARKEA